MYLIIACTQYWLLPQFLWIPLLSSCFGGRLRILFRLWIPSFFIHSSYNLIPNCLHSSPICSCLLNEAPSNQISNNLSWWLISFSVINRKVHSIRCFFQVCNITSMKLQLVLNIVCVITNISNGSYSYFMNWNNQKKSSCWRICHRKVKRNHILVQLTFSKSILVFTMPYFSVLFLI